jgi:hypothetical protein
VIKHDRLIDQEERRTPSSKRFAELRDLGPMNEVIRPDGRKACRLKRRKQGGRSAAPDRDDQADCDGRSDVP